MALAIFILAGIFMTMAVLYKRKLPDEHIAWLMMLQAYEATIWQLLAYSLALRIAWALLGR